MTSIVGVHGVGYYHANNSTDALSARWASWITTALGPLAPSFDITVPFYAPALHPLSERQGAVDDNVENLDWPTQKMIHRWIDLNEPPAAAVQGWLTAPLRQGLEWVATRWGLDHRLVRVFVSRFFREVATYLDADTPAPRLAAREIVCDAVRARRPQVVIAHSLGSVVAYEALWTLPDVPVDLLITLGSPLGMPDVIYPHLAPSVESHGGRCPESVRRWINIADPGDLIAIPRRLGHLFEGVTADLTSSIGVFDFHRVKGYLANPTTLAALSVVFTHK